MNKSQKEKLRKVILNKTIQTLIKRNSKYKNNTYTLSDNDFNNLLKDLSTVVKPVTDTESSDRIERLRIAYNTLCELVLKDKTSQKEINRNVEFESSPPCRLSMLSYKIYIDNKIEKLINAICETVNCY